MSVFAETASPLAPALLMESGADTVTEVIVHPMVLLHVLDHHTRRPEASGRVIGTLLGRRDGRKVEVTNCFAVPHAEKGEEVAIGKDFNKQMLELHMKANKKETIVGWYASAASEASGEGPDLIADTSSLIHEFYAGETDEGDPIHLVLDTSLREDRIGVRAFRSTPVMIQNEVVANLFHELRYTMSCSDAEALALDTMASSQKAAAGVPDPDADKDKLEVSMTKLLERLDTASAYVDSVVDGKTPGDVEVGRQIANIVASVPGLEPEALDDMFSETMQDLLMVSYLSNITKTQLTIADKLNATLGV